MDIGVRIKKARLAAGISQVRLANLLGVTRSACSQWELSGGGTSPRGERLAEIARLLDISYEWLATGHSGGHDDSEVQNIFMTGSDERSGQRLTAQQRELLALFDRLSTSAQAALLKLLSGMADKPSTPNAGDGGKKR
ncbi:transcriptional regulator with XRE-family HTH domain [Methylohalomonas lacus]|uniref:Transcriptional regulator with XRE-family HTH domain n=1 Tax=Methylohalomonas lacus TaxID=398773 RepID=A0AAE3L100_9GAMM|nr:helix-turn-helix transcriptional regulator [Methylohalomonas lacus]MCS3903309.1 transcriptional regulator with XRE-family HTH domain [Methylohalomonas lacus]